VCVCVCVCVYVCVVVHVSVHNYSASELPLNETRAFQLLLGDITLFILSK